MIWVRVPYRKACILIDCPSFKIKQRVVKQGYFDLKTQNLVCLLPLILNNYRYSRKGLLRLILTHRFEPCFSAKQRIAKWLGKEK